MKLDADCNKVHIGTLEVIDNPDLSHHRIKFYEIADDLVTNTGKTVTIEKDDWSHQLDASNAIVAFFEELTITQPEIVKRFMEKHGITYREGDGTP